MPGTNEKPPFQGWQFATAGIELAVIIVVFVLIGRWIDDRYGSQPIGIITGAVIGVGGGLYRLIREAKKSFR